MFLFHLSSSEKYPCFLGLFFAVLSNLHLPKSHILLILFLYNLICILLISKIILACIPIFEFKQYRSKRKTNASLPSLLPTPSHLPPEETTVECCIYRDVFLFISILQYLTFKNIKDGLTVLFLSPLESSYPSVWPSNSS